ncbi:MAG: DUF2961 domain-containing protein [Bacteroidota bacterium]|nr:DUF2961 domain-containing protein [Bacteroidota bacterium]MDP4229577.1 DUF2961 domain-containing protein [Bacteroidota bacterium]MDP4236555.1 DUF2961 domain-containing protein [Bacteroidota bacterium]
MTGFLSRTEAQTFDPYARLSDPRAICRLDGPDSLPLQFQGSVGWPSRRDTDQYFIAVQGSGSGILTHIWLMYHDLPTDSSMKVRIWIDDSLLLTSDLYYIFKKPHGALRAPLDSLVSGGLDCEVQIPYKKNFKISFITTDYSICCLFWAVEYRPIVDPSILESFRLTPSDKYMQQLSAAERAYHNTGSPWNDPQPKTIPVSSDLLPGESIQLADIAGPGMIETLHIIPNVRDVLTLRNLWLRIYWDGSPVASVNAPVADFFGLGAGPRNVHGFQIRATADGDLTCYFPMPFAKHARIEIANLGPSLASILASTTYSEEAIDRWNQGYFTTQFVESYPARWHVSHYVGRMLGRGKYLGMQLALPDDPFPYYLEGDPIFTIDSNWMNTIHYTGLEDYLDGGWFFSDSVFSLPFSGCPSLYSSAYRFHCLDPYDFQKTFQFELQHGVGNDYRTDYRTVAFFYRRWTPFWVDRDTVRISQDWNFGGSGYAPNERIVAKLDNQILFTVSADSAGVFSETVDAPPSLPLGEHWLSVNGYTRPEPVYVFDKPTVRFLFDTGTAIFRWRDSVMIYGNGFKPGEKVRIFFDTTEAWYLSADRFVNKNGEFLTPIRIPWTPDGNYYLKVNGDQGTEAIADTAMQITRTLDYECEDLPILVAEAGLYYPSYLGYFFTSHWSNQFTMLFYPTEPDKKMILSFVLPLSDTFHISLFNTIGLRYGNYDISIDNQKIASYSGFNDTDIQHPMRSKEVDGGVMYLTKGVHTITYLCTGKDAKAKEFLLDADNIILTPTTAFHPLPYDSTASVFPPGLKAGEFSLSPNPLSGNTLTLHIDLDSNFKLGSDWLIIELYDILGRKAASLLNATVGAQKLDIVHDCSSLAPGKYICRIMRLSGSGNSTQSLSLIIDR